MGVLLVCLDCDSRAWTDLVEFDDMPIADWWASKGRRCVGCRRRGARPARRRRAGRAVAPAAGLLPSTGTKRRAVYDLLLAVGERGASFDDLCRALSLSPAAAERRVQELTAEGLVESAGEGVWRVTSIERVSG